MNRQYFNYLFKSRKNINIFLLIVNIIFTSFNLFTSSQRTLDSYASILEFSSIIVLIECFVMPIIIFFYRFSKRASDTFFSLPLTRKELFTTSIFYMAMIIVSTHLIAAIPVFAMMIMGVESLMVFFVPFIQYLVFLVIVVLAVLNITSLIIFQTNTTFDAIAILMAYILLPVLGIYVIDAFGNATIYGYDYNWFFDNLQYFFIPILFIHSYPSTFIEAFAQESYSLPINHDYLIYVAILAIAGIISYVLAKKNHEKHRAEEAEQISNRFFAYQFVIIYITVMLVGAVIVSNVDLRVSLFSNFGTILMLILVIFIAYQIMTFIFRRKILITRQSIIVFLVAIVFNYSLIYVSFKTCGFGLAYSFENETALDNFFIRFEIEDRDEPDEEGYYDTGYYIIMAQTSDNHIDHDAKEIAECTKAIQKLLVDNYYTEESENAIAENEYYIYFNVNIDYNNFYYRYSSSINSTQIKFDRETYIKVCEYVKKLGEFDDINFEISYYSSDDYETKPITFEEFLEAFDKEI